MYFPKLFELFTKGGNTIYDADFIARIDNTLGELNVGDIFQTSYLTGATQNLKAVLSVLDDLKEIGIISEVEEQDFEEEQYQLLIEPLKKIDAEYEAYKKNKRQMDSFSIILKKTKAKKSGTLILIDLKGYSKNLKKEETNAAVIQLTGWISGVIKEVLDPYFLNNYSGIQVKQNGDGWLLYFLDVSESYQFLLTVMKRFKTDEKLKNAFEHLQANMKAYLHHTEDVGKVYQVDTLHFDIEGNDVVLIHMIEKFVEKELYHAGHIKEGENFIAITDTVYKLLPQKEAQDFKLLKFQEGSENAPVDSEGNSKLYKHFDIYFREV